MSNSNDLSLKTSSLPKCSTANSPRWGRIPQPCPVTEHHGNEDAVKEQ